jgi:hypothetical protein
VISYDLRIKPPTDYRGTTVFGSPIIQSLNFSNNHTKFKPNPIPNHILDPIRNTFPYPLLYRSPYPIPYPKPSSKPYPKTSPLPYPIPNPNIISKLNTYLTL